MCKYNSPTTPGLDVTFRNYIIELVCLNINKNLKPRFWKYQGKYWQDKYSREIKGVHNLCKSISNIEQDSLLQKAAIEIIIEKNIKCLLAKKTVDNLSKTILKRHEELVLKNTELAKKSHHIPIDKTKNMRFVDVKSVNKFTKIRGLDGKKED